MEGRFYNLGLGCYFVSIKSLDTYRLNSVGKFDLLSVLIRSTNIELL